MKDSTLALACPRLLLLLAILTTGCALSPSLRGPVKVDQGRLHYIATLPEGRLVSLHVIHRADEEMHEVGPPQPVFIRDSEDNGFTWSEPRIAFHHPAGKGVVSGGCSLVDRAGNLHSFAVRYFREPTDATPGDSSLVHNVSEDGGQTWSETKKIDYGHPFTGALNSYVALRSGRLIVALSYSDDFQVDPGQCLTVFSDDGGNSWMKGSDRIAVPAGPRGGHPGALEPVMVELEDGRVWMIIRTQRGRFYQAFSGDSGETWSETSPTAFEAPNAPGAILRLSDGRLVFCWNDLSQFPEKAKDYRQLPGGGVSDRRFLHISISSDDGTTWSRSKQIARREEGESPRTNVAYPFLCETADHSILVTYHRVGSRKDVTWWSPSVEVLRIDPAWIDG
jgi:photosystem II stability/assembly factor-like uncharacterized protein